MSIQARNASYTKEYNRKLIFNLLLKEPMSRSELSRQTGLTRSALTLITDDMIAEGLVFETNRAAEKQGRVPVLLDVNKDGFLAVGVYLNRERCAAGLVNLKYECLYEREIDLSPCADAGHAMDVIGRAVRDIIKDSGADPSKLFGVGVSAPGPVDRDTGRILNPPDFQLWQYANLGEGLSARTGYPVMVDNDAYALADFSRQYVDSTIGCYLFLKIGPRVGSGIVYKGNLYRGVDGISGEIGHMSIDHNGRKCPCGNSGCLELYASFPHLLREFGDIFPSWDKVVAAAAGQDRLAIEIVRKEAGYLSAGVVNTLNALNLEAVVLAGDILSGFDLLAPMVEERVNSQIITRSFRDIRIISAQTGMDDDIAASANIVFSKNFAL